jgi:hypothetical protein
MMTDLLKNRLGRVARGIRKFHEDEDGPTDALTNIILLAVGAVVVAVLYQWGGKIIAAAKALIFPDGGDSAGGVKKYES